MKDALRFFILPLVITTALFCYPYYQTRHAPASDGNTVIGWPMTAYSFGGGMCLVLVEQNGRRVDRKGGCPPHFYRENAVADAAFVLGVPLVIYGAVALRRRRRKSSAGAPGPG
jgi:hypothetical protein